MGYSGPSGERADGSMRRRSLLLGLGAAGLAGCARISQSRFNPFNWFGRDRRVEEEVQAIAQVDADPRLLVDQVISIEVEQAPGGGILYATGLTPRQGYWDAELLLAPSADDLIVYQFRVFPPTEVTRVSTQASREVTAAVFLTDQTLIGVREIRVLGARASRAVSR